jgi:hypothetical protein
VRSPAARRLLLAVVVAACGPAPASTSGPTPPPPNGSTPVVSRPAATLTGSAADLEKLDRAVRARHASPFTIHPESEWAAAVSAAGRKLESAANDDQRLALLASVVGLLDTHTFIWRDGGLDRYPVYFYHFTEGWFVIAARDPALVGAELRSIGGWPIDEVEAALRPLVAHDNEMGYLLNVQGMLSTVAFLHGSGIVADTARPAFGFELPDGSQRTDNLAIVSESTWGEALHLVGTLVGAAPEAVRRHTERAWSRLEDDGVFLLTVNDYGDEKAQIDALKAALEAGTAKRVVLDIRYLPGGSGDFALLDVLKADARVNRPGGLVVLMGRENYSIANAIVRDFDVNSEALLVGEPTPARADNFRCECFDIWLSAFGVTVTIPTWWDRLGDDRVEVPPDVRMDLSAAEFFAGRDPVLEAALAGIAAP